LGENLTKVGGLGQTMLVSNIQEQNLLELVLIKLGYIETIREVVKHLFLLRELQSETKGFMSFIPLEYKLGKKKIVNTSASPIYTLKIIAISRILLHNFPHIKAYWASLGKELTEISLHYGASDIDGTIGEEKIMHSAGAESPISLQKEKLIHLISSAGYIPAERDALYNIIKIYNKNQ
jgi:aminodeoxyfutalosine synthase